MTLHPDVLTDLVILYHAGEASEASRRLLGAEARRNPRFASAPSDSCGATVCVLPFSTAPVIPWHAFVISAAASPRPGLPDGRDIFPVRSAHRLSAHIQSGEPVH